MEYGQERRDCANCHAPRKCAQLGAAWLCPFCQDKVHLQNGQLPCKRTTSLSQQARADYLETHLAVRAYVDVWLVPLSPWCDLLMARLVMWRRYGAVAGLLVGPPASVFPRRHGRRFCDRAGLARYFRELCTPAAGAGIFPAGSAPLVVTGTTIADLALSKQELANHADEEHRQQHYH